MKHTARLATMSLAAAALLGLGWSNPAQAARCTKDGAGNWACTYQITNQAYRANNGFGSCIGATVLREVRWQVPEGTPPAGGWPVVFYYQGTLASTNPLINPFVAKPTDSYGSIHLPQIFHELLDDPRGTGRKYAVIAAEAPYSSGLQFWHTNTVNPYASSYDYCFLPALFSSVSGGGYGAGSQYNMARRFAFGISSGGYNSSRMAATFNAAGNFKALGIFAASYATCGGASCTVPSTLPANHPPTKFWHGTGDTTVPISTMRSYYNRLVTQGIATEKVEHTAGHEFTAHGLGATGVRAWFDRY